MSGIDAGIRVGKYEVGRKLGQGGFGVLYVARDHELGRDVAIKFLRPEHAFKPTVVQRFLQEARAAARINHPGIVTVFESGIVGGTNTRADGTVYIAMELLAGDTLATKIRNYKRLPATLAINYARQLASALGAAHQAGIVHRDLKPANVFVVADSAVVGGERLKVLDFGIAKLVDDFGSNVQTHSMLMLGTPMYMSPEQCKSSAKVDARSDIYALGCMLFEMLCGKTPFDGDSGELIAKHQLVPAPTPRSIIGEVPVPLDRLITSMLAKSPDERPQTMAMVEAALSELDSRAIERLSLMGDAGDAPADVNPYAPTTVEPSAMRRRLPFIAGGLGAAALGIAAGLFSMCGDKRPAAQATVANDARIATVASVASDAAGPTLDEVPATADTPGGAADLVGQIRLECQELQADGKWAELAGCSEKLAKAGDIDVASRLGVTAKSELQNDAKYVRLAKEADYAKASKALEGIPEESWYRAKAQAHVDELRAKEVSIAVSKAGAMNKKGQCDQITRLASEITDRIDAKAGELVLAEKADCGAKTSSKTATAATCNADALKDKGMELINAGDHAAALASFEASLKCKNDAYVLSLAFMAACNAQNEAKAQLYWAKLNRAEQTKFKNMCVRNHIDPTGGGEATASTVKAPADCDADSLKDKGMENVNMGQHAAALAQFEASLRCKNDRYVMALAFMAACNAQNAGKAKQYYNKLDASDQTKYREMCVRNHIDPGN